ncbi:MAG: PaaI family thioesterase [Lachnospiraceae bacterium]|nr:PaaI family thioesterase [Lachnospiraceae bacterium]
MDNRFEEFDRIMREEPGFIKEMGIELIEIKEGYARGRILLSQKHNNPMGTVHGGLIFGLADTIGGRAAMSYGDKVVTLNANICYLNAAASTSYIEAEATEVKNGKTTAIYDVMIRTAEGVEVAKVVLSYFKVG